MNKRKKNDVNDSWKYIEESHRENTVKITSRKYSGKVHDFCAVTVQRKLAKKI